MAFAPVSFVDGDPQQDFFEQNPQLVAIDDIWKMKDKPDGSKLMWAVYFTEDPKSKMYSRPLEFRRDKIANDWIGDSGFNWDTLHKQITAYNEFCISRVARTYALACAKYDEAVEIVMNFEMNEIDDVGKVNAVMYKALDSMNTAIEKAADRLAAEINSTRNNMRGQERPGAFAARKTAS